ncbi:MAG: XRE family transcriptional regulator [Armatimonadetes bacterium]|nr:XRE family transcriptional regulator [Armatimonadota bacterium]
MEQNLAEQIGQRIRDLRARLGLSQQQLAQQTGIAASTLSEIENGRYAPNLKTVVSLAEALGVSLETLLRASQPPLQALLRTVESPANARALRQGAELCYRYAQIESLAAVEVTPAPTYAPPRSLEEAEQIAVQERERLQLGIDPIADVVSVVENNGLRVVGIELPNGDLAGALFHDSALGSFALINRSVPPTRQLFTLLHEYAHYLMHRDQPVHVDQHPLFNQKGLEALANRFAAAFLMPEADMQAVLTSLRLPGRKGALPSYAWALLRRRYRVSLSALAWRLFSLGWISEEEREWALQSAKALYAAEQAIFGDLKAPEPIPSLTERAIALALHVYARGDATASFTAETLRKPLALILEYLQLLQHPAAAAQECEQQGGDALEG